MSLRELSVYVSINMRERERERELFQYTYSEVEVSAPVFCDISNLMLRYNTTRKTGVPTVGTKTFVKSEKNNQ